VSHQEPPIYGHSTSFTTSTAGVGFITALTMTIMDGAARWALRRRTGWVTLRGFSSHEPPLFCDDTGKSQVEIPTRITTLAS